MSWTRWRIWPAGTAKMGGRTGDSYHLAPGAVAIEIKYGALGGILMNAADIKNLFVHEYGGHIGDLRKYPSMKVEDNHAWLEKSATVLQMKHPTWKRVSPEFRSHIIRNQSRYLN